MDSDYSPLDPPGWILWDPVQNFSFHEPGVGRTNQDVPPTDAVCHVLAELEVKKETVSSVPVSLCGEGVAPPVTVCEEGVVPSVTVSEEGVVNLWRAISSAKGFSTDTDLAKFLMTLYMNHDDPDPGSVRAGDLAAGRQQTDTQTAVHLSQEVSSQTDRPSFRDGKSQTEIQCSKCTRLMALVCINRQCQRSPVAATATGTLLQAEPSGVGRVTGRSSGDEMDVEEFSGFEAESSAEDSDLETVMSAGCPAQAKQPLAISKKNAQSKKRARANPVVNSLQPIVKLRKCDFTKHASQTSAHQSAKAENSAFSSRCTKDKAIKRKSNVSVESGAKAIRKKVVFNKAESGKKTTTDRSDEDSREKTGQADRDEDSREKTGQADRDEDSREKTGQADRDEDSREKTGQADRDEDSREKTGQADRDEDSREKTGQADSDEDSREKTGQADRDEDSREKTGQADPATLSAESDGCPDTKRQRAPLPRDDAVKTAEIAISQQSTSARRETATSPRATSARRSTRSSGPPEVVQPAEQPVTTETGKYPIADGVAYKNGKIPGIFVDITEFRCSRCDKVFHSRGKINHHIWNPSCDDGNDDLFKRTRGGRESAAPKSDEEWTPELAPTKDPVKKTKSKKIRRLHKRYRSMKSYTLQEFMTGKIGVPLNYDMGSGITERHQKRNWHFSHYTCLKCYTVFEMRRLQFWKHEKGCNGIRDRDSVVTGREHQRVKDEHAALELEDDFMAPEDSQSNEDVAKTAADCQLTEDQAKITADSQPTKDLAKNTPDRQLTEDLVKTTADSQLTNDLAQTTADSQLTGDGADQCQTDQPRPQPGGEDRQLDPESIEILMRVKERYLHCCPECDIVFFNKEQQKMHTLSHFYTKAPDGNYTCQVCNKQTIQKLLYMQRHLQIPKKRNSKCEQCGLSFKFKCQIYPHTIMHLKEATRLKKEEAKALARQGIRLGKKKHVPLLCPICGRLCPVRSQLQKHMRTHSDEKPYACSVCGFTSKSESSLKAHEATHDGPQFQCEDCGKEFFNKQTMTHHRKVKHMGQVFPCQHCGKELSSKSKLREHTKRVHLKMKSYTCSICGFGTGYKDYYKTHMRTHTGEKPFQCDICLVRFARADYLRKHVRLHTGERPYSCDDCSQRFVCGSSLKHHRVRHHSDKTFPCDVCEEVSYTVASRDFHRYMAHGGAQPASVFKNKKRYPCNMCSKVLHSSTGLEFHIRKHLESDQKASEHQEKSSEYQESNQMSSEYQERDHMSLEHQERDHMSLEHQERDHMSLEHQERDQMRLEHQESDQMRSEHQESDQMRSEHQESDQMRSEYQESNQMSSEYQERDHTSLEHQERDHMSLEHQERDHMSLEHQERDQMRSEHQESDQMRSEHQESDQMRSEHQ